VRRMDKLRNMAHLHLHFPHPISLIKFYFMLGLRHGEILLLLSMVDDKYAYTKKDFKMHGAVQKKE